jgi:hypothetical protein
MKPKRLYLVLCVAGTLLPYSQFVPFVQEHGLDLRVFFEQLFSNRIGGFFGLDVIVSVGRALGARDCRGSARWHEAPLGSNRCKLGGWSLSRVAALPLHA